MKAGFLDRENLRRNLTNPGYDSLNFLFAQANNEVSLETNDLEGRLLNFFDRITIDITELSNDIENEISMLQKNAFTTESFLLEEMEDQSQKLVDVENAVEDVKEDFQSASDAAVRVGNKLANSERERLNIKKSIDLMKLIREFENSPDDMYSDIFKMNAQKLRETLPDFLKEQDWFYISQILYDLKKILFDINSEDVQKAQQVVINVTEVVEMELLGQFDVLLDGVMEDPTNQENIAKAKSLAECLHLFNNGQSLHKRYIFSVVEKRIPSDALLGAYKQKDNIFSKVSNAIKKHGRKLKLQKLTAFAASQQFGDDDNASDSSSGASASGSDDESDEEPEDIMGGMNQYQAGDSSLQLIDHLSRLFTMINRVCLEQFAIIKKVFPGHTIPRVTRQLIQRIFNDPAFGIQARVDAILNPQPPAPSLSIADYLDALLIVREKLSALNVLLLECAADASMIGMGSEVMSMRKAKKEIVVPFKNSKALSPRSAQRTSSRVSIDMGNTTVQLQSSALLPVHANAPTDVLAEQYLEDHELENEEKLKSDAEIKEFFYEQSSQVLINYLHDYFDKEISHVRNQYVSLLRRAVDEHGPQPNGHGKVSAGTVLQLPHLRAERMKSIEHMVATVANRKFLDSIFNVTTDAVIRMESIGRDDKKLPNHIKDLYLLQLGFVSEGLILPWSKASITMLLRLAGSKPQNSTLPPVDVLPSLVALTYGKHRLNTHFSDVFLRPLSASPNLVAACKESKKKYFSLMRRTANESLFAWTLCVASHLDKLLLTLQGKYDYQPILEGLGAAAMAHANPVTTTNSGSTVSGGKNRFPFSKMMGVPTMMMLTTAVTGPSPACDAVCKAFIQVTHAMRRYESEFVELDLNSLFWQPCGQQFVGMLIAHFRRQTISVEGARQLRRDLEEYRHVTALMNSPETSDMIVCLEELVCLFEAVTGDDVVKVVTEDLRHLDTAVVLGLVRQRADFASMLTGNSRSWAKALSAKYLNYKWETSLPWEGRKPVTIMSFREAMAPSNANKLGPKTLRRSGNAMPNVYANEAMRLRHLLPPPPSNLIPGAAAGNKDDVYNLLSGVNLLNNNNNNNNSSPQGSRTMSLDLRALETGRQNIIDRHIRDTERQAKESSSQPFGNGSGNGNSSWNDEQQQQRMSRFLPSRPDEDDRSSFVGNSTAAGGSNINGNSAGMHSQQPFHVQDVNGLGYAGPNALPQRRVSSNTATTTGINNNNRNNPTAGTANGAASTGTGNPTMKNMLQKVSSFFR